MPGFSLSSVDDGEHVAKCRLRLKPEIASTIPQNFANMVRPSRGKNRLPRCATLLFADKVCSGKGCGRAVRCNVPCSAHPAGGLLRACLILPFASTPRPVVDLAHDPLHTLLQAFPILRRCCLDEPSTVPDRVEVESLGDLVGDARDVAVRQEVEKAVAIRTITRRL